jgi:hypothetical protein
MSVSLCGPPCSPQLTVARNLIRCKQIFVVKGSKSYTLAVPLSASVGDIKTLLFAREGASTVLYTILARLHRFARA